MNPNDVVQLVMFVIAAFAALIVVYFVINAVWFLFLLPFRIIQVIGEALFGVPCDWMNSLFDRGQGRPLFGLKGILCIGLIYLVAFHQSHKTDGTEQLAVPVTLGMVGALLLWVWLRHSFVAAICFLPLLHIFTVLAVCRCVLAFPAEFLEELPNAVRGFCKEAGRSGEGIACEHCGRPRGFEDPYRCQHCGNNPNYRY